MSSQPPASASARIVDPAVDRSVEIEVQARRDEFSLGISRYVAWVCGAVSILLGGLWFLARPAPQILIYAVLTLLLALGAGLYPAFHRRNRTTSGLYLVYGLSLLLIALSPLLIPSLMAVIGITDVIAMMVAMLLLGDRGSRWLVGALALAYLADLVAVAILGWIPFPPLEHSIELWVTSTVGLVVMLTAIVVIRLIVLGLEQQFRQAQRLNRELEQQIQEVNQTQAALKRERNLLRTLIDTAPANVYIKDTQCRFVDANAETIHKFGASTSADLFGKTDFDFFTPELAAKYFADDQAVIQSGQPLLNVEEPTVDQRTQQNLWLLTTKAPIRNERGEVTGLVGVGFDITDRKQIQEQIAQERDLLRALIDHLPDYIFVKDADGRFVNSNAAHNRVAQVKDAAELWGKSVFEVFPQPLAAQFEADDQRVLHSGQALVNVERTSLDAEGRECIVLTTKVPLRDPSGTVTGLVGISRDITEHKQAEQQVLELRDERQRVEILRQFIGDATHDLMTPIAGINLSAYLARIAPDQEHRSAHLVKIEALSSRLQKMLQDMLTMSKLDMMTPKDLELRPVDLDQLLRRLVETYRPRAQAKGQQLSGAIDPHAGTLQADELYLAMALGMVLENAIHYTETGGTIHISIARQESQVAIAIRDTGIGIAEDDLGHIFERFYRAKNYRPLDAGAGLGLSITERIIELHGGRVEVTSVVAHGSTFTLLLPGE